MGTRIELRASVSGSFSKAKPEIDLAIEELRDHGVNVLGPSTGSVIIRKKGGLYLPYHAFAPLPSETGMTSEEVEQQFIEKCIKQSDFILVVNSNGYVGLMVTYEMSVADSIGISIYSRQPINAESGSVLSGLATSVRTIPIRDIVSIEQEAKALRSLGQVHPLKPF